MFTGTVEGATGFHVPLQRPSCQHLAESLWTVDLPFSCRLFYCFNPLSLGPLCCIMYSIIFVSLCLSVFSLLFTISATKPDTEKPNLTDNGGGQKIVKPKVLVRFRFSLPVSPKDFSLVCEGGGERERRRVEKRDRMADDREKNGEEVSRMKNFTREMRERDSAEKKRRKRKRSGGRNSLAR